REELSDDHTRPVDASQPRRRLLHEPKARRHRAAARFRKLGLRLIYVLLKEDQLLADSLLFLLGERRVGVGRVGADVRLFRRQLPEIGGRQFWFYVVHPSPRNDQHVLLIAILVIASWPRSDLPLAKCCRFATQTQAGAFVRQLRNKDIALRGVDA